MMKLLAGTALAVMLAAAVVGKPAEADSIAPLTMEDMAQVALFKAGPDVQAAIYLDHCTGDDTGKHGELDRLEPAAKLEYTRVMGPLMQAYADSEGTDSAVEAIWLPFCAAAAEATGQ
jgi:hypothetical protein